MLAIEIGVGIWIGGMLLVGTFYAFTATGEFIKRQKYSGVEWYRWF